MVSGNCILFPGLSSNNGIILFFAKEHFLWARKCSNKVLQGDRLMGLVVCVNGKGASIEVCVKVFTGVDNL